MNQHRCETCKNCNKNPNDDYFCLVMNDEIDFTNFEHTAKVGCASHSDFQSGWDTVLDDCCNIDLTEYTRGERESDEVGLCRGRECNYCGRYNEKLRQSKTDPVFISCNTPAHAFRLDLKNEQSERDEVLDDLISWIRETKDMARDNLDHDWGTKNDRHVELILSRVLDKYDELRQAGKL
jgi:hypothetical protein